MDSAILTESSRDDTLIRVFDMINDRLSKIDDTLQQKIDILEHKIEMFDARLRTTAASTGSPPQHIPDERLSSLHWFLSDAFVVTGKPDDQVSYDAVMSWARHNGFEVNDSELKQVLRLMTHSAPVTKELPGGKGEHILMWPGLAVNWG